VLSSNSKTRPIPSPKNLSSLGPDPSLSILDITVPSSKICFCGSTFRNYLHCGSDVCITLAHLRQCSNERIGGLLTSSLLQISVILDANISFLLLGRWSNILRLWAGWCGDPRAISQLSIYLLFLCDQDLVEGTIKAHALEEPEPEW